MNGYQRIRAALFKTIFGISLLLVSGACTETKTNIHISCTSSNDITDILQKQENIRLVQHKSAISAVENANTGDAVLIFADEYPAKRVELSEDFFRIIREKKLRVYIEYPSYLPGIELKETEVAHFERAVATSSFFNGFPDSLQILSVNGLNFIPVQVKNSHIVAAKVAGFDEAVFGLPEQSYPLLFELPDYPVMVSTTKLSQFVKGRYAPQKEWANVWKEILAYLLPKKQIAELQYVPVLAPSYGKTEELPIDYQKKSIIKGSKWFFNAKMLAHESSNDLTQNIIDNGKNRLKWSKDLPIGNGSNGVYECIFSDIDEKGSQPIGISQRGDCIGETAMALASAGTVLNKQEYIDVSRNLLDFYFITSSATKNEYGNPNHGAYGLLPWGISNNNWYKANYGDDNARLFISALTTSALTGDDHWDEILMRTMLASLRTTGISGFRERRIDLPDLEKNGWEYYYNKDYTFISPHFEAYLWACMLWAYNKTGDPIFLERTKKAIKTTMENYPDKWLWTNGLAQEKARMILPLAWLVRIDNTQENKAMLLTVVNDLLKLQDECGALREELGNLEMGKYPPPQSNEEYGTTEAPLIAKNGDPVSDLLYTTNFAFLGLHEAYYATKDPAIKKAYDKLAEFLCRIQVASEAHPQIDGSWMRTFDFDRYEHWGSNADHEWGAWVIESGWTQGWIVSILALREMDKSIWDLTKGSKMDKFYAPLKKQMLSTGSTN